MEEPRVGLVDALAQLTTAADLDLTVRVNGATPYVVRFRDGECQIVAAADPEREVVVWVTGAAASRVAAGEANAQQLLAEGSLRISGRMDVLQEQAAALAATRAT